MKRNKTNQNRGLKQENGAISTLVLFTVFMFVTILMAVYFGVTTMQKSQLKSDMRIQDIYGQEVEKVDQVYEEQVVAWNQKEQQEIEIGETEGIDYKIDDEIRIERKYLYNGETKEGVEWTGGYETGTTAEPGSVTISDELDYMEVETHGIWCSYAVKTEENLKDYETLCIECDIEFADTGYGQILIDNISGTYGNVYTRERTAGNYSGTLKIDLRSFETLESGIRIAVNNGGKIKINKVWVEKRQLQELIETGNKQILEQKVTTDSNYGEGYEGWNAFDGIIDRNDRAWESQQGLPHYIQYQFEQSRVIRKIKFYPQAGAYITRLPSKGVIKCSEDGENYTTVYEGELCKNVGGWQEIDLKNGFNQVQGKYWRIEITETVGGIDLCAIGEIVFLGYLGSADTTELIETTDIEVLKNKVRFDSCYGEGWEGYHAFDGLIGTDENSWEAAATLPQQLEYEFDTAKTIRKIKFYPQGGTRLWSERLPAQTTIKCSNDGENYTTVFEGILCQNIADWQTVDLNNYENISGKYWKLEIDTTTGGGTPVSIGEMIFIGF